MLGGGGRARVDVADGRAGEGVSGGVHCTEDRLLGGSVGPKSDAIDDLALPVPSKAHPRGLGEDDPDLPCDVGVDPEARAPDEVEHGLEFAAGGEVGFEVGVEVPGGGVGAVHGRGIRLLPYEIPGPREPLSLDLYDELTQPSLGAVVSDGRIDIT